MIAPRADRPREGLFLRNHISGVIMVNREVILGISAFACLFVSTHGSAAQAGVIYSNLGGGDSFNSTSWRGVSNLIDAYASPFTPATDTQFGSAEVAFSHGTNTNSYLLELMQDDAGAPGVVIESIPFTGESTPSITVVNSILTPALTGGDQYWVGIRRVGSAVGLWYLNDTGDSSDVASLSAATGTWTVFTGTAITQHAFRVNDSPVGETVIPEPSTFALLSIGALALVGYGCRRKRRKAA